MIQNPLGQRGAWTWYFDEAHVHNLGFGLLIGPLLDCAFTAKDVGSCQNPRRYGLYQKDIEIYPGPTLLVEHREPEKVTEGEVAVGIIAFPYTGAPCILKQGGFGQNLTGIMDTNGGRRGNSVRELGQRIVSVEIDRVAHADITHERGSLKTGKGLPRPKGL